MKYFTTLLAVGLVSLAINPLGTTNGDDDDPGSNYFYRSPTKKSHFANSATDSEYESQSHSESGDEDIAGPSNKLGASSSKSKKRTSKKRRGGVRKGTTPGCRCGIDCPICTISSPHPGTSSNTGGSDAGQERFEEWLDLGFDSDLVDTKDGLDADEEDSDIILEDARTAEHMVSPTAANSKEQDAPGPSGSVPSIPEAGQTTRISSHTSDTANGSAQVIKPARGAKVDDESKEKGGKLPQNEAAKEAKDKPDSKTNPGANSSTSNSSNSAATPPTAPVPEPEPVAQSPGANTAPAATAAPAPVKAARSLWSRKGKTIGLGQVDTTLNPQGTSSNTSTPVTAAGQPPSASTGGNAPSPASATVGNGTRPGSAVEAGQSGDTSNIPAYTQELEDIRGDEGISGPIGEYHQNGNAVAEEKKIEVKADNHTHTEAGKGSVDERVQNGPTEHVTEPTPQSQSQNQGPLHIREMGDAISDALPQPPNGGDVPKVPDLKGKGKARAPTSEPGPKPELNAEAGPVTSIEAGPEAADVSMGSDKKGQEKTGTAKDRTLCQNWASSRPRYTLQQKLVPGGFEVFDEEIEPCPCCGR